MPTSCLKLKKRKKKRIQKQVGHKSVEHVPEQKRHRWEEPQCLVVAPPVHVNTGPGIRRKPCRHHDDRLFVPPSGTTGDCSQPGVPLSGGGESPAGPSHLSTDFPCLVCMA